MRIISTLLLLFCLTYSYAGGDVFSSRNPYEKTYVKDIRWMPNIQYQAELRELPVWQNFLQRNGDWWVMFNEENRKPHRAFGKPIATTGTSAEDRARNFIATELAGFRIPMSDLVLQGVVENSKHKFIHFTQMYNGFPVIEGRLVVKLTHDNRVIMFGTDVYSDINISTSPAISSASAASYAMAGINETILSNSVNPQLSVLPIAENRANVYHLVYTVNVETIDSDGIPAKYYTLVDAVTGEVHYRQNMVAHIHGEKPKAKTIVPPAGIDVTVTGSVYTTHSFNPATVEPLPNLQLVVNSQTFNTDLNGFVATSITGPQSGTFSLRGLWSIVRIGSTTATQTTTLADGPNSFQFTNGTIQERSAYYHVNIVHDHCVAVLPGFTGMNFALPTNVDLTTGNCNAFYNGTSINFYATANGCTSFATVGDVVYHEYGHGINDNFYSDGGSFFQNGAMGEGYADFWAYSITLNPILGEGTNTATVTDYIRRYDINKKVYPANLVGQVHADGEIIAGAWWDTYLNLGNDMNLTMDLFAGAYPGFQAATANGNEGKAFTDVLIDVLQYDDTDADLTNGTPNGTAIVDAFDLHGITLISNAKINHTAIGAANASTVIPINATLTLNFPYTDYLQDVLCYYKVNNGTYTATSMTNTGGNNYTTNIPGQNAGTVIGYYLAATDINNMQTAVVPVGCDLADPNIPNFILVGCQLEKTDDAGDFLSELGNWQTGLPSDNNTTGDWELNIPVPSYSTAGDTSTVVQTYYQNTVGGEFCFLTGNAPNASDPVGTNDVDAGHTTLLSAVIDMSAYLNPVITYYRWYINNPPSGANPNADWWQVSISNDGGSTWTYVENSKTSDKRWRRYAFRVEDYVTPTANMRIKFVASDSTRLGQNLDGGSLVEAAVDDIQLWDRVNSNSIDEAIADNLQFVVKPNPTDGDVMLMFELVEGGNVELIVSDITGKQIISEKLNNLNPGLSNKKLDLSNYDNGIYQVQLIINGHSYIRKVVLSH